MAACCATSGQRLSDRRAERREPQGTGGGRGQHRPDGAGPAGSRAGCGTFETTMHRASTTSPTSSPWRSAGVRVEAVLAPTSRGGGWVSTTSCSSHRSRASPETQAEQLMRAGVTLADPARLDVRGKVDHGRDVSIDVNCVSRATSGSATACASGQTACCATARSAGGVVIPQLRHRRAPPAPTAHRPLRPPPPRRPARRRRATSATSSRSRKPRSAPGSKANHLSYVGDARIGRDVNVGAGTITCNYDGANKHRPMIERRRLHRLRHQAGRTGHRRRGRTIGAGSTISQDAPAGKLTLERSQQVTVDGWQRPVKAKK